MELWTMWTHGLQATLGYLSLHFGLSEAVSIIVLTLIARVAMMPISLTAAYRSQKNKDALERIKPALDELRKTYQDNPSELATRTMALYRENGITFLDKVSMVNMGAQGVFGLGVFQCLKRTVFNSKFLWIPNLAKPDFMLTVLVGALMVLGMALMPGAATNASMLTMMAISVMVSIFAIAALPSALGIYWATSNAVTVVQTLALRGLLARITPQVATNS
ncbi:MAG: membrane protein insertase YidC [Holophagaceae bacterium]|nr:membrane protein insertase YidC [Holophagaceae bacterium]